MSTQSTDRGGEEIAALRTLFQKKEFTQEEKTFIPIGCGRHIFVVPDIFLGQVRVNIREYFVKEKTVKKQEAEEEEEEEEEESKAARPTFIPTRRGVSLTVSEFELLCEKVVRVQKCVKRLGKRLRKQH